MAMVTTSPIITPAIIPPDADAAAVAVSISSARNNEMLESFILVKSQCTLTFKHDYHNGRESLP